jgi:Domain of unknown function (DUF4381)
MLNPLPELKGIELPTPIGWWPLAWGWWALLVVFIIITVSSVIYWRKNRYRFFAKKRLAGYFDDYQQTKNLHVYCQQAVHLLRELAITRYGRSVVSSLSGNEWIVFLNAKMKRPVFDEIIATYLTQAPFCDADYFNAHFTNADINKLHKQLLAWVRQHQ